MKYRLILMVEPSAKIRPRSLLVFGATMPVGATVALSAVEEQVERTSFQDAQHRVALALLTVSVAVVLLLMLAFSLGSPRLAIDFAGAMWLHPPDLNRV
jgi:hypothetical protein